MDSSTPTSPLVDLLARLQAAFGDRTRSPHAIAHTACSTIIEIFDRALDASEIRAIAPRIAHVLERWIRAGRPLEVA